MTYFKYFSKYVTTTVDKKLVVVTDIFKRVGLGDEYKNIAALLIPYLVEDGETPELVSNKFYNTPEYHWVILLVNGVINPREEWAMKNADVEKSVYAKYPFTVVVPDITKYSIADKVSKVGAVFEVVDINSETQQVMLTSQSGIVSLEAGDVVENETKGVTGLTIAGVNSTPTTAIHHYIDTVNNVKVDVNAVVEDGGVFVKLYQTLGETIVPITNLEYELSLNDEKRTVNILDSKYLGQFVRDFKNTLG